MATTNPVLTTAWSLIVTAGDDFMLELPPTSKEIEAQIAIRDTETIPTVTDRAHDHG